MKNVLKKISDWYFNKNSLPYWCVLSLDCVIVLVSNLLMYLLNNQILTVIDSFGPMFGTLILYLVFYIIGFKCLRTYSGVLRYSSFLDLGRIGCAMMIGWILIMVCRLLFNLDSILFPIGGKVLFEGLIMATLIMWLERILVKFMYDAFFAATKQQNVFIYGVRDGGIALAKSIRNSKPSIYNLKGWISDDVRDLDKELMAKRVFKNDENIVAIMKKLKADVLLVSPLKSEVFRENTEMQMRFIDAGIKIMMMPNVEEWKKDGKAQHTQLKEVEIEDLLPREQIQIDMDAVGKLLRDKVIMITGSAGSIGSEMVRQVAKFKPKKLVLIDSAETPQHDVRLMMARKFPEVETFTIVTTICSESRMEEVFKKHRPEYVFHAAAYKHVPMMEDNPAEAIFNNVRGTQILAKKAVKYGVKKFVMISTDKAVNPTNVMGCSKRICEMDVQSMDCKIKEFNNNYFRDHGYDCPFELAPDVDKPVTQFVTTRFGNVLGSNGSVIPLFKEQISNGGPVTVTHKDIIRFFMLIPEACKLVLEAGTMGNGGEIFVFDMGKPVKIVDLAKRMIKLSGAKDVEIKFTGLRDGEKLYEEVLADKEQTKPTCHPKIMIAAVREVDYETVQTQLEKLIDIAGTYDDMAIVKKMKEIVPEYKSQKSIYQVLD